MLIVDIGAARALAGLLGHSPDCLSHLPFDASCLPPRAGLVAKTRRHPSVAGLADGVGASPSRTHQQFAMRALQGTRGHCLPSRAR